MRKFLVLAVLAVVGLANLAVWWWPNRPVEVPPIPGGRLQSVSFAPFRDGQSPLVRVYPSRDQIEEDLRLLARQVQGVRTYTSLEGMEAVPELARKYGLTVTAGAWIGVLPTLNEAEVQQLIRSANAHPDVVQRVIVGNEVLLRKDRTLEQLIPYIRRVKAEVKQPVGYADVWENFIRFPAIVDELDYLVIHILPYWEDIPGGIEHVEDHIRWAYRQIKERWPDKPIMIGETGWPTAGRSRGPAEPGRVNKALFIQRFAQLAGEEGFDYNIIEAFDQRWKERLEGTVGAKWGLMTADRKYKFTFDGGPVVEEPDWRLYAGISTLGALIMLILSTRGRRIPVGGFVALAALAQVMGSGLVASLLVVVSQNFVVYQIAEAWALFVLQVVVAAAVLQAAADAVSGVPRPPTPRYRAGHSLMWGPLPGTAGLGGNLLQRLGETAVLAMALWGVYASLALIVDGRYRNFPVPDFVVPSLGLFVLGLLRWFDRPTGAPWWSCFSFGHLLGPARPVAMGSAKSFWQAARMVPLAALVVVGSVVGAIGVTVREVWLQGLDWHAIPRVAHEAGFATLATNGINWEALAWVVLQSMLAVPFYALVRHVQAGALEPHVEAVEASRDARGWDGQI